MRAWLQGGAEATDLCGVRFETAKVWEPRKRMKFQGLRSY